MPDLKITWTYQAKSAFKTLYDYYKKYSPQGAENVKSDILQATKSIHYSKQYQVDEVNPKYRRIIVRDFKILYKESENSVWIIDIINTKQRYYLP